MIYIPNNRSSSLRAYLHGRLSLQSWITGFSLIEMLVVVTLIAITAVSVMVNLRGAGEVRALRTAADDLAGAIRFAFEESRLKGVGHRLLFASDGKSYLVEADTGYTQEPYRHVAGVAGMPRRLPGGIQIVGIMSSSSQQADICSAIMCVQGDGGFSGMIELRNGSGGTAKLEVIAGTGQVHVVE